MLRQRVEESKSREKMPPKKTETDQFLTASLGDRLEYRAIATLSLPIGRGKAPPLPEGDAVGAALTLVKGGLSSWRLGF